MNYKIIIFMLLLNILPTAYAIDKAVVPLPTLPSTAAKSITNSLSASGISHKTANATDPYQYCFNIDTWVVPPETLLAYLYDDGRNTPAADQTVWIISNYDQGYFFGKSYTAITSTSGTTLSEKDLIGSVTAEGKVSITFYSGTSTASTSLVSGIGSLSVKSSGQCSFSMQMNSGQNGISGLAHWSYMIPVSPGDPYYENLPGTDGESVPEFLTQFEL